MLVVASVERKDAATAEQLVALMVCETVVLKASKLETKMVVV